MQHFLQARRRQPVGLPVPLQRLIVRRRPVAQQHLAPLLRPRAIARQQLTVAQNQLSHHRLPLGQQHHLQSLSQAALPLQYLRHHLQRRLAVVDHE